MESHQGKEAIVKTYIFIQEFCLSLRKILFLGDLVLLCVLA